MIGEGERDVQPVSADTAGHRGGSGRAAGSQAGAQAAGAGINLMANELGTVKPEDTSNVDAINQQVEAMTQKFNQSMEDLKKKRPLFPNN